MKASALAHPNIALIKYWGRKDETLRLPLNASFSFTLDRLYTRCEVALLPNAKRDRIAARTPLSFGEKERVFRFLDRVRAEVKRRERLSVLVESNVPKSVGLASSAAFFAALSAAAWLAYGRQHDERRLSILARLGSGSATRSVPGGFVLWPTGDHLSSYGRTLLPPTALPLVDACIPIQKPKEVASSRGQQDVSSSFFIAERLRRARWRLRSMLSACEREDAFEVLRLAEEEALEFMALMLSQKPPLLYATRRTLLWLVKTQQLRERGLAVFFTVDAGPSVHWLTVRSKLRQLRPHLPEGAIVCRPGNGVTYQAAPPPEPALRPPAGQGTLGR